MKRDPAAPNWPTFDAPLLRDVSSAFLRRRKAIAYHTGLTCSRNFTESATGAVERLHLVSGHLQLAVWEDGGLWVGAFIRGLSRNAGWAFQDAFHGDMLDVSAGALVGMFEASGLLPYWPESEDKRERLRAVWSRIRPRTA
jgi:hypothetical protein